MQLLEKLSLYKNHHSSEFCRPGPNRSQGVSSFLSWAAELAPTPRPPPPLESIPSSEEKLIPIFQCIRFVQRLCIIRFKVKVSSTSKRSTRGCVHSLPAHASIQRRAHVAQSEWWEVEYESKHIPNFNWSFLLNCTINLKLDWNIVFVRINVTKLGPICYLYFLYYYFNIWI